MSSANTKLYLLPLQSVCLRLLLLLQGTLQAAGSTVLGGCGGSRHPGPVADPQGKAFSLSLVRVAVAAGLSCNPFIGFSAISSLLRVSFENDCLILSDAFSASIEMTIWFSFFSLLMW